MELEVFIMPIFSKLILTLLLAHFVGDFVLQSRRIATNKSSSPKVLLLHVSGIALTLLLAGLACLPIEIALSPIWGGIVLVNVVAHALIDATIWNCYKIALVYRLTESTPAASTFRLRRENIMPGSYRYWEDYWFWTTVGLDQFLHTSILVWSLNLLWSWSG